MTFLKHLIVIVAAAFSASSVFALEPERREVIVTHNRVWDGYAYHENFVPSDHDEMLLLSGKDNAVTFVRTQEYYWPLARQNYVAFETQREEIAGNLMIRQNGKIIDEVVFGPYVVLYPEGAVNGDASLIWGQPGIQAFEDYKQGERDFVRDFSQSQREQSRYNQALKQAGIDRLAGKGVQDVTPPPPAPVPSLKLVTEPRMAFRVELEAGDYQVEIVMNGAPVSGTAKTIRVIESTDREFLIAEIIPEERWTRPIPANTSADKIYTTPGAVFYTTLALASSFDEADYIGLTRPQGAAVSGREILVKRRKADNKHMEIDWGAGSDAITKIRSAIKVEQTQGSEFGYVVRAAREGESADLRAFTVAVPNDTQVTRGYIRVVGEVTSDLVRQIVVVQPRNSVTTWGLALLPLLFGISLQTRRRRSKRARA